MRGATRRFGSVTAVEDLDLRVERGEVYGFLGLNGAGKTTTIRMLLGLVRPGAGEVRLLGERIAPGRGPWARVGHMVESPTAYPELTVRENLAVSARLHGLRTGEAVARAIDELELGAYADRRAGTLSLGNLQRLGLARALLHGPELLLLDEPANGLDPAGVVEIRELIGDLARSRGVTVFMSSHVLAEVDRLATRIGIIHRGRLIDELDTAELELRRARWLTVDARDRSRAADVLSAAGYPTSTCASGLRVEDARAFEAPDEVARLLVAQGIMPTQLTPGREDLEAYFLRLTGGAS